MLQELIFVKQQIPSSKQKKFTQPSADGADLNWYLIHLKFYRGADKSLARPGRKQATATDDFDFHISYL